MKWLGIPFNLGFKQGQCPCVQFAIAIAIERPTKDVFTITSCAEVKRHRRAKFHIIWRTKDLIQSAALDGEYCFSAENQSLFEYGMGQIGLRLRKRLDAI